MNHQPRGLVQHQHVLVFIYYIQRDIFRHDRIVRRLSVYQNLNHVQRLDFVVGRHRLAVSPHMCGIRCLLDAVARRTACVVHQKLIHAQRSLPAVRHNPESLKQLFLLLVLCIFQFLSHNL